MVKLRVECKLYWYQFNKTTRLKHLKSRVVSNNELLEIVVVYKYIVRIFLQDILYLNPNTTNLTINTKPHLKCSSSARKDFSICTSVVDSKF